MKLRGLGLVLITLVVLTNTLYAQQPDQYYKIELSSDGSNWADITQSTPLTLGEKPNNAEHNFLSIKGDVCKWAFPVNEGDTVEGWYFLTIDNTPYKKIYIKVSLVVHGEEVISVVSEPVFVYSSTILSTIIHLFNQ